MARPFRVRAVAIALLLAVLTACGRKHGEIPELPAAGLLLPFARFVNEQATQNRIAPGLLYAIIAVESGGNPRATGRSGSLGLMQLKPATAARYGVSDLFDPAANIMAGAKYLRDLLTRFRGDIPLALAAYNSGPSAVLAAHGIPPASRDYVNRVLTIYQSSQPRAALDLETLLRDVPADASEPAPIATTRTLPQ